MMEVFSEGAKSAFNPEVVSFMQRSLVVEDYNTPISSNKNNQNSRRILRCNFHQVATYFTDYTQI